MAHGYLAMLTIYAENEDYDPTDSDDGPHLYPLLGHPYGPVRITAIPRMGEMIFIDEPIGGDKGMVVLITGITVGEVVVYGQRYDLEIETEVCEPRDHRGVTIWRVRSESEDARPK